MSEAKPEIPKSYRRLEGSERRIASGANLVGPADPKETLTVTILIRRRSDAPALPDQNYYSTMPSKQRAWLSEKDFAAKYGADPADMKLVTDFVKAQGLTVVSSNISKRTVIASGTVNQMNHAFGVKLSRYKSPTETYRGREGPVHVPNNVAEVIKGVFGLDNRRMARRANVPTGASPLTPPQVAGLYNFPASGATPPTIGLLEFGGGYGTGPGYNMADIDSFFSQLHLTTPKLTPVPIDGQTNNPGVNKDVDGEVALDIDVAGSVAQGAPIAVYFAPWTEQGWIDVLNAAIHPTAGQPTPSVISISYGWAENESASGLLWSQAAIDAVSTYLQEAAAKGITVFVASGDDGSNCQIGDGYAHVSYPASDPWVTACGGTIIKNVAGSTFTEGTWNDSAFADGVTGGGISEIFDPSSAPWQAGAGVPPSKNPGGRRGRGVPDIAGNASPYSGYRLQVDGVSSGPVGGTSAVAPLYAGLVAIINAIIGTSVGYLNPMLYNLGGAGVFRDVNDGVNNSDGSRAPSYVSGPGWDACTGWGSIDGNALCTALQKALPPLAAA